MSIIDSQNIISELHFVLVQEYALYLKTQTYHWNIRGPHFLSYHKSLEEHYTVLQTTIDDVAERIRALGSIVKANFALFQTMQSSSNPLESYDSQAMLQDLVKDHKSMVERMKSSITLCESNGDPQSAELLVGICAWHEKILWMLNATLNQ